MVYAKQRLAARSPMLLATHPHALSSLFLSQESPCRHEGVEKGVVGKWGDEKLS